MRTAYPKTCPRKGCAWHTLAELAACQGIWRRCQAVRLCHSTALIEIVLLSLGFLLTHDCAVAALKFEGWIAYEVGPTGRVSSLREGFSLTWERENWLISTALIETKPQLGSRSLLRPAEQQVGTDGQDLFYLEKLRTPTEETLSGVVEPGNVPKMHQSPSVALLWLCFGSHALLASERKEQLPQVWSRVKKEDQHAPCLLKISYSLAPESPGFLRELSYLSDGRLDMCNPKRDPSNLAPKPWDIGYTQAVYRAIAFDRFHDVTFPAKFRFDVFGARRSKGQPQLSAVASIYGAVTNVASEKFDGRWLPVLPSKGVPIADYRFLANVTNWDCVRYSVSNRWLSRGDPSLAKAVAVHANTVIIPRSQPIRNAGRFILIAVIAIPMAIAIGRYFLTSRVKTK